MNSFKDYKYIIKKLYQHLFVSKKELAKILEAKNYSEGKTKIIRFGILKGKQLKDDVVIEIKICE